MRKENMNFGTLITCLKKFANNRRISNEKFINEFMEPYIHYAHIKTSDKLPYEFSKSQSSKLINHKQDLPEMFINEQTRYGFKERLEEDYAITLQELIDIDRYEEIKDELISHTTDKRTKLKLENSNTIDTLCAEALLISMKNSNCIREDGLIWERGLGKVIQTEDDILNIEQQQDIKIIVIPVNSTFDTEVTRDFESCEKPVVSSKTLHGKWLEMMLNTYEKEDLDIRIENNIFQFNSDNCLSKCNINKADIGSICMLQEDDTIYYLLAISKFDSNNCAHTSEESLNNALDMLFSFYNQMGQGYPLYIPLIGTGLSRSKLTNQQALKLLIKATKRNMNNINGQINIVIYSEN